MMNKLLLKAYKSTTYQVFKPNISFKIGETSKELDSLLRSHINHTCCFITAYNPFSESLSESENQLRQSELKKDLSSYKVFEGAGVPADDKWSPEPSFLVMGIDKNEAIRLAKKHEQNAIVFGEVGKAAELVITTSTIKQKGQG